MKINASLANARGLSVRVATETTKHVYAQLCRIVDEWLETLKSEGKPLPPATAGQGIAHKIA